MSNNLNEQLLKTTCQICLDNIEKGDNISIPPCECKNLLYHTKCYFKWLETSSTCPTCREKITIIMSDDEDDENNNDCTTSQNGDIEEQLTQEEYDAAVQHVLNNIEQEHGIIIHRGRNNNQLVNRENNCKGSRWTSCALQFSVLFFLVYIGIYSY
jgi:hypothetical protein